MSYPVSLTGAPSVVFTVRDSATNQPVEGALCTLYQGYGFTGEGRSTLTNSSGVAFVDLGYPCASWRVTKVGYVPQDGVDPDSSVSISFVSTVPVYPVTVGQGPSQGTVTLSATLNGVAVNVSFVNYAKQGDILVVTATPGSGSSLTKWTINGVQYSPANPISVIVQGQTTVLAFVDLVYTLLVTAGSNGTTLAPWTPGAYTVTLGQQITVTASPNANYAVDHWVLDGVDTSLGATNIGFTIIMLNHTIAVLFKYVGGGATYTLTASVNPSGSGTLSVPASSPHPAGEVVSVKATPATGFTFTGWSGAASGTANPVSVTMDADKSIVANFTGGGEGNTKSWYLLQNYGLMIPYLGTIVERMEARDIKWDPAKTTITSVLLNVTATSESDLKGMGIFLNGAEVGGLGWPAFDAGTKSTSIDVKSYLANGANVFKFTYWDSFGRESGVTCTVNATLVVTYTGDEPPSR